MGRGGWVAAVCTLLVWVSFGSFYLARAYMYIRCVYLALWTRKVLYGNFVCTIYIFIHSLSFVHSGLASRCLQLVVHYIPRVQAHFEAALPAKNHSMLKHFDKIVKVGVPEKCVVFIYEALIQVDTNLTVNRGYDLSTVHVVETSGQNMMCADQHKW